jgi:hypothetical protein
MGILLFGPAEAAEAPGILWRGVEQTWGYNHRVGRIGSWVDSEMDAEGNCVAQLGHGAASGTGPDRAEIRTEFTVLGDQVRSQSTVVALVLHGREGELIEVNAWVDSPFEAGTLDGLPVAVLGGFDLQAQGRADKLQALEIHLDQVEEGRHGVQLRASLMGDCDSPECEPREEKVSYVLRVHVTWLALGEDSNVSSQRFEQEQEWGRWRAPKVLGKSLVWKGEGGGRYPFASVAWTGIALEMKKAHHLLEWHSVLHPQRYDAATGEMHLEAKLGVLQWRPGMKWARLPYSLFSYRQSGTAHWRGEALLIQLSQKPVQKAVRFEHIWPGRNLSAADPQAFAREELKLACHQGGEMER